MAIANARRAIISGNTFPNKEMIRLLGAQFDPPTRTWIIDLRKHPMNTLKKRAELEKRILALGEVGCLIEWEK